jgi:hypothetical protein
MNPLSREGIITKIINNKIKKMLHIKYSIGKYMIKKKKYKYVVSRIINFEMIKNKIIFYFKSKFLTGEEKYNLLYFNF